MGSRAYHEPYQCPDCGQFVSDDLQARRWNGLGYGLHDHQRTEAQRIVARAYIAKTGNLAPAAPVSTEAKPSTENSDAPTE